MIGGGHPGVDLSRLAAELVGDVELVRRAGSIDVDPGDPLAAAYTLEGVIEEIAQLGAFVLEATHGAGLRRLADADRQFQLGFLGDREGLGHGVGTIRDRSYDAERTHYFETARPRRAPITPYVDPQPTATQVTAAAQTSKPSSWMRWTRSRRTRTARITVLAG